MRNMTRPACRAAGRVVFLEGSVVGGGGFEPSIRLATDNGFRDRLGSVTGSTFCCPPLEIGRPRAHLVDELGRLEHIEVDADHGHVDREAAEPVGAGSQQASALVDCVERPGTWGTRSFSFLPARGGLSGPGGERGSICRNLLNRDSFPARGRRSPAKRAALLVAVVLATAMGAGLLGCQGDGEEAATETATATSPAEAETETEPESTDGEPAERQVYLSAGCGTCHGENAEGTDVGPALAGHAPEQVRQQVRSPLAQMPAYSVEQLSDEDLEAIAEYIASLEPMEEHVEPVKLSEVLAIHHWMAISAIAADDRGDALHHVGHIIEAVEGEHLEAMTRAREFLREGDLHEAEHLIEEMLAGKAEPELSRQRLALRLALTAVDQGDRAEAIHQLGHFIEAAKGAEREKGQAVLAHLREGDLHGAEHGIADLLGIERD